TTYYNNSDNEYNYVSPIASGAWLICAAGMAYLTWGVFVEEVRKITIVAIIFLILLQLYLVYANIWTQFKDGLNHKIQNLTLLSFLITIAYTILFAASPESGVFFWFGVIACVFFVIATI